MEVPPLLKGRVMKIRYKKHGYYNCNYPPESVVEVDDAYGRYVIGIEDAVEALPTDKITPPTPYIMKERKSAAEDALVAIANVLTKGQSVGTNGPKT